MTTPEQRAWRILRKLSSHSEIIQPEVKEHIATSTPNEQIVGVLKGSDDRSAIVFTNSAVWLLFEEPPVRFEYSQLSCADLTQKDPLDHFVVVLKTGERRVVRFDEGWVQPIRQDIPEIIRFLNDVIHDARRVPVSD